MPFQNNRDLIPFIRMYAMNECLWNYRLKIYRRNDLKEKALEQMSAAFGLTVVQTKKKIKSLRDTYNMSKKRLCKRQSKVDGGVLAQPLLFWYSEMAFLDAVVTTRGEKRRGNSDVSIAYFIVAIYIAYILHISYTLQAETWCWRESQCCCFLSQISRCQCCQLYMPVIRVLRSCLISNGGNFSRGRKSDIFAGCIDIDNYLFISPNLHNIALFNFLLNLCYKFTIIRSIRNE